MHLEPGLARAALAVSLVTGALVLATACSGSKPSERTSTAAAAAKTGAQHPEVGTDAGDCASCHESVSPQVVADWSKGRHGMALVKCFVCHGSTGPDFRARPEAIGCRGCHPVQAAATTSAAKEASPGCFTCHPPHLLRASQGKTAPHPLQPSPMGDAR